MKVQIKSLLVGVFASAFATQALAYTISGVIPPGHTPVVINLHRPIGPGLIRFVFSAPRKDAGVLYALDFCIGPAANPCGRPGAHVVNVPVGATRSANFSSALFSTNVLVVGQGTRVPAPYSVRVN